MNPVQETRTQLPKEESSAAVRQAVREAPIEHYKAGQYIPAWVAATENAE